MRVIEIFTEGKFPKLVLEAKKEFAATYGLQADYWRHFDVAASPEVLSYLKGNLRDLAAHHHALYQNAELAAEKPANYAEALRWYREFLASFPQDPESPPINYQLADLLLENGAFGEAALEYERTAYDYPAHEKSPAAGYAAIYAHRQDLKGAGEARQDAVRVATVASSLRFADAFPGHEQAPTVLGAAADDLYGMKDFRPAIAAAQKLIDGYPAAEPALRRAAFTVVAHSSLELGEYPQAEQAYSQVLVHTPTGRQGPAGAGRQPRGDDLQAGRAGERGAGLSLGGRQFPARREGGAGVADPGLGGVRRRRGAHPAAGLDRGGRSTRSVPDQLAGPRAEPGGDAAARVRLPRERPAGARGRRIRACRDGIRRPGHAGGGAAGRGRALREVRGDRTGTRCLLALRRAVPAADRRRHRDTLQDRRLPPGGARRHALPGATRANRPARRRGRAGPHQPHPDAGRALGARPHGAALSRLRRFRAATAVRDEPGGEEAADGRIRGRLRAAHRLRDRRGDRGRDLLPRRKSTSGSAAR